MHLTCDALWLRLCASFPERPVPEPRWAARLSGLRGGELDRVLGRTWREVALAELPPVYLSFLTGDGLAYYFPAFVGWLRCRGGGNVDIELGTALKLLVERGFELGPFGRDRVPAMVAELDEYVAAWRAEEADWDGEVDGPPFGDVEEELRPFVAFAERLRRKEFGAR